MENRIELTAAWDPENGDSFNICHIGLCDNKHTSSLTPMLKFWSTNEEDINFVIGKFLPIQVFDFTPKNCTTNMFYVHCCGECFEAIRNSLECGPYQRDDKGRYVSMQVARRPTVSTKSAKKINP